MSSIIDVEDIIRRNQGVDPDLLKKSKELKERLDSRGVQQKGYEIAVPYAHKARPVAQSEVQLFVREKD